MKILPKYKVIHCCRHLLLNVKEKEKNLSIVIFHYKLKIQVKYQNSNIQLNNQLLNEYLYSYYFKKII
jgi:hypothetical protein